jgi:hypothetical protein
LHVEKKREFRGRMRGTVDALIDNWDDKELIVLDYKNGRGEVVATQNRQMAIYAAAAMEDAGTLLRAYEKITMAIVAPNGEDRKPVKTWTVTADELSEFAETIVRDADRAQAVAAGREVPTYNPGPHCKYCAANRCNKCPALNSQALDALPDLDAPAIVPPVPESLTPEKIGQILTAWPMVKIWADAVEEEAVRRLQSGQPVPGWKMVEGVSRRVISDPDGLIAAAAAAGWTVEKSVMRPLGELDKAVPKTSWPNS